MCVVFCDRALFCVIFRVRFWNRFAAISDFKAGHFCSVKMISRNGGSNVNLFGSNLDAFGYICVNLILFFVLRFFF